MNPTATLTELTIVIAGDLSALLRVVSVLHARAANVSRLRVGAEVSGCRHVLLEVDSRHERRVVQALERCVAVISVRAHAAAPSS